MVASMLRSAGSLLLAIAFFPVSPTITTFRTRDFGGKPFADAIVRSSGDRLRIDAFGRTFLFDGRSWHGSGALPDEESGAVAFLALYEEGISAERADSAGRPTVLVGVPAGKRKARVEYRWDGAGLAAANLVFSDGSGFQFRRAASEPAALAPSDFEPPLVVAPPASGVAGAGGGGIDDAAVARLFSLAVTDAEQLAFEREGGVGRYRPRPR
jgi:hypothetical protein